MRTTLIAVLSALALTPGTAAAQTDAPARPAVGETSQSLGVVPMEDFLEKSVVGANAQPVGTVEDVMLGPDGQPQQLIVSTGPGGRSVAIDLSRVEVRSDSSALFVSTLTREEVEAMPAFADDGSMTSLNASRTGEKPAENRDGTAK